MTDTSRAAGLPACQLGMNMSAGREEEFGTRDGASSLGARAAD